MRIVGKHNFGKGEITRFIAIIAMSLFGEFSSANAQEQYRNDNVKFSFSLPEGWERTPYDKLSQHYQVFWNTVREKMKAMEHFSMTSSGSSKTPYIYMEGIIDTSKSEAEKEARYLSYKGREHEYIRNTRRHQRRIDRLREGSGGVPHSWKRAKLVGTDFYYDQKKHAAFVTIELYRASVGKILFVNIRLLGSRRFVSLNCYWDGENPDEFLDLLDNLVDSFSYDEGYGFGESPGIVVEVMEKVPSMNYWTLGILIGFGIVLFLLYRFAKY